MTYKHEHRRPATVWILVADRARARLFQSDWPALEVWAELESLVHPESAAHPRDVEADRPGQFGLMGGPPHPGEGETDFKHRTANEFAGQLVERLQQGKNTNSFGRLVIVAPALFLGVIRERLPRKLRQIVVCEIDKDLTHQDVCRIGRDVREVLLASGAIA